MCPAQFVFLSQPDSVFFPLPSKTIGSLFQYSAFEMLPSATGALAVFFISKSFVSAADADAEKSAERVKRAQTLAMSFFIEFHSPDVFWFENNLKAVLSCKLTI